MRHFHGEGILVLASLTNVFDFFEGRNGGLKSDEACVRLAGGVRLSRIRLLERIQVRRRDKLHFLFPIKGQSEGLGSEARLLLH